MLAILQVADTGPLESLVVMLRSIGIDCALPDEKLRAELRRIGCDTVVEIKSLVESWGYDQPFELPYASLADMARSDVIYVDVKAHRNGPKVWSKWPNLEKRTLWYRINGSKPEHCINERGDHGDEVNPPCPVLTPNMWYKNRGECTNTDAYVMWPPFYRFDDYQAPRQHHLYEQPFCLVHNLAGWGYGALIEPFQQLGIKLHGVRSPDGLINHREVPVRLSKALAYVHLKSNDAPGYALYEALASACPVICTRRLIWRCRMESLLIPGETCLTFDRESHDALTDLDVRRCTEEVQQHLAALRSVNLNKQIGEAGRAKLQEVMWSEQRDSDVESLRAWYLRNFT